MARISSLAIVSTRVEELLFLSAGLVRRLQRALSATEGWEEEVQGVVQVLRCLGGKGGAVRTDPLLGRLVNVLAAPLEERGLTLGFRHSSREPAARVDGTLLCATVARALRAMAEGMPAGYRGSVVVDLCAQGSEQVEILVELAPGSGQLPFEVDLLSVQQELQRELAPVGGMVVLMGRKLSLHLPVLSPSSA